MVDKEPLRDWLDGYRSFPIGKLERHRAEEVSEPTGPRLPTWAQRLRDDSTKATKEHSR